MLGAIIGDIIGSPYEFNNVKSKRIELFTKCSHFTDDTVMTVAVAKGLAHNKVLPYMVQMGMKYHYAGYGKKFKEWLISEDKKPYESYGNGAAMRVSSIPYLFTKLHDVLQICDTVTNITHNHPQSIRAARAVVHAIHLGLKEETKNDILNVMQQTYGYDLNFSLDSIRESYKFDVSCDGSVPQAIVAFLESDSYEDAVRNAISIGGDSDTIAAIAGSIAYAYYGHIRPSTLSQALPLLTSEFLSAIDDVMEYYNRFVKPNM